MLLLLQSVGVYVLIPRVLPWAENWLPFQGAPFALCSFIMWCMLCHLLFGSNRAEIFWNLNTL